jgi:hypothetical protein
VNNKHEFLISFALFKETNKWEWIYNDIQFNLSNNLSLLSIENNVAGLYKRSNSNQVNIIQLNDSSQIVINSNNTLIMFACKKCKFNTY